MLTPLAGLGLFCVLLAKKYSLKRNIVKAGDKIPPSIESTPTGEKPTTTMEDNGAPEPENVGEPLEAGTHNPSNKEDKEVEGENEIRSMMSR